MIRAVLEIAAYGRANFIADARFALRDYDHVTWRKKVKDDREIRAGWLKRADRSFRLTPVEWQGVSIAELVSKLGVSPDNWHRMSLACRMDLLTSKGLSVEIDLGRADPALVGRRGTLVVSGAALRDPGQTTNKAWEAAFLSDPLAGSLPISGSVFEAFDAVQTVDGDRRAGPPDANWSYWRPKLFALQPVPVFYRGDPTKAANGLPPASVFFMSLTRLHRIHYDNTLHAVLHRTQPANALPPEALDLVEGLFGSTPLGEPGTPRAQRRGREIAWRGRVYFHHARLTSGDVTPGTAGPVLTMSPRASFYPYYLRPRDGSSPKHPVDYDNPEAVLAGRKRYPARGAAAPLPAPPPDAPEAQASRPQFLPAAPGRPLVWTSRIRLHNVSPVELGALVWAITLGQEREPDQGFRHMLGGAKAFGRGQTRAAIDRADLERNDGQPAPTCAEAMEQFETWALDQLASKGVTRPARFADLPEIRTLLAMAHAPTGQALAAHLLFPETGTAGTQPERILAAYKALRDRSGHGESKEKTERSGAAGRSARVEPPHDDFIGLPSYPTEGVP